MRLKFSLLTLSAATALMTLSGCSIFDGSSKPEVEKTPFIYPDATGQRFLPSPALTEESGDPGFAARPYTAAELRAAMPIGYMRRYRVTERENLNDPQVVTTETRIVTASDEKGCTIRCTVYNDEGRKKGNATEKTETWDAMRHHADFEFRNTTRRDVRFETEAGMFECWEYTLTHTASEGRPALTAVYRFPRGLAGAPISVVSETGGSRSTQTLLEQKRE
jgi:hypothetical protein